MGSIGSGASGTVLVDGFVGGMWERYGRGLIATIASVVYTRKVSDS